MKYTKILLNLFDLILKIRLDFSVAIRKKKFGAKKFKFQKNQSKMENYQFIKSTNTFGMHSILALAKGKWH